MKQLFKKPSYYLISSAMDGNEKAIEKLLAFYDPYISKCCLRSLYDEYGNVYLLFYKGKAVSCVPHEPEYGRICTTRFGPFRKAFWYLRFPDSV